MKGSVDPAVKIVLVLLALAAITIAVCPAPAQSLPSGYYKHYRTVSKAQQQVYGLRAWSSLLLAQVHQESGWRPCPISPAGARGLTQFMPGTQRAVEAQYGVRGDICDPAHAGLLQGYYMRDLARFCGERFAAWRAVWYCSLRSYNGGPGYINREWAKAGAPRHSTIPLERFCRTFRAGWACRENLEYPRRIFAHWPKYLHWGWNQ